MSSKIVECTLNHVGSSAGPGENSQTWVGFYGLDTENFRDVDVGTAVKIIIGSDEEAEHPAHEGIIQRPSFHCVEDPSKAFGTIEGALTHQKYIKARRVLEGISNSMDDYLVDEIIKRLGAHWGVKP